jgi:TPR repeat protein
VRAEDRPKFEAAVVKAESGDAAAELRLGIMYDRGIGVERDFDRAFECYLSAAEKGDSLAQLNTGVCYGAGIGVEMSKEDALYWLEKAANDPRLPEARYKLGTALWKRPTDPGDRARGFELLKASADPPVNNQEAQYEVGVAYEDGDDVVAQDFAEAKRYYEMAVASGFEPARVNLANMALLGKGGPKDIDRGIQILERAAVQQATMAMCNLGDIYSGDRYGRKDLEKAKQWFKKAADLNFPYGMLKLAVALRREAIANPARALELNRESAQYMQDAAERGNVVAMTNFGKFLMEGTGVRVNIPQAIGWLNRAAGTPSPKQSAEARFLLGQILYDGKGGMAVDRNRARDQWEQAAAAGNEKATIALARHFP